MITSHQKSLHQFLHFFLVKIVIGVALIACFVALTEWAAEIILRRIFSGDNLINIVKAVTEAGIALGSYVLLYTFYEKRKIKELSISTFGKNAFIGFVIGMLLQSLFVLVIYMVATYNIIQIQPLSFLMAGFTQALTAGFVAELIFCGVVFRIIEKKFGTAIALIFSAALFMIAHAGVKGATLLSICATSLQAGIMLNAAYVFSRSLWLPIFLHFGWDFAEPAVYGGINPGISIQESLITSRINGPAIFTGAQFGPQNSIQSIIFCAITTWIFLFLAKRKNNFIQPHWKKRM